MLVLILLPNQSSGLARTILRVGKEWMKIANRSEFMQSSFRKYQWREALLLCLAKFSEGLVLRSSEMILDEMKELAEPMGHAEGSRITAREFLTVLSNRHLIPMAIKPHSIFFLCSEQNFISACFDWLLPAVAETREVTVSMSLSPGRSHDLPKVCSRRYKKDVSFDMQAYRTKLVELELIPWSEGNIERKPKIKGGP